MYWTRRMRPPSGTSSSLLTPADPTTGREGLGGTNAPGRKRSATRGLIRKINKCVNPVPICPSPLHPATGNTVRDRPMAPFTLILAAPLSRGRADVLDNSVLAADVNRRLDGAVFTPPRPTHRYRWRPLLHSITADQSQPTALGAISTACRTPSSAATVSSRLARTGSTPRNTIR
jgi:hypothetical protein